MAAVVLMERNTGLLSASDLDFVEGLVRGSKTWAYVDGLACDVAGGVVLRDPTGTRPVLDRWAADADFWVRRSALLSHLLPLRQGAPWAFAQFTGYADGMLEAELDIVLVDYLGGIAEGKLMRGDNPVLMTMELVLEVL